MKVGKEKTLQGLHVLDGHETIALLDKYESTVA